MPPKLRFAAGSGKLWGAAQHLSRVRLRQSGGGYQFQTGL